MYRSLGLLCAATSAVENVFAMLFVVQFYAIVVQGVAGCVSIYAVQKQKQKQKVRKDEWDSMPKKAVLLLLL